MHVGREPGRALPCVAPGFESHVALSAVKNMEPPLACRLSRSRRCAGPAAADGPRAPCPLSEHLLRILITGFFMQAFFIIVSLMGL